MVDGTWLHVLVRESNGRIGDNRWMWKKWLIYTVDATTSDLPLPFPLSSQLREPCSYHIDSSRYHTFVQTDEVVGGTNAL